MLYNVLLFRQRFIYSNSLSKSIYMRWRIQTGFETKLFQSSRDFQTDGAFTIRTGHMYDFHFVLWIVKALGKFAHFDEAGIHILPLNQLMLIALASSWSCLIIIAVNTPPEYSLNVFAIFFIGWSILNYIWHRQSLLIFISRHGGSRCSTGAW